MKYTAENAPAGYRGKIGRIIELSYTFAAVKFFDGATLLIHKSNLKLVTQDEIMIYRLEN